MKGHMKGSMKGVKGMNTLKPNSMNLQNLTLQLDLSLRLQ